MALLRSGILLAIIGFAVSQELFCSSPSQFYISNFKTNWYGAVQHCNRLGMRLAVVDAEWKQNDIVRLAQSSKEFQSTSGQFLLWIGANDLALEGKFIWHATGLGLEYTHWKKNEPNNLQENEHCIHMWYEPAANLFWEWNDKPCLNMYYFVCENINAAP